MRFPLSKRQAQLDTPPPPLKEPPAIVQKETMGQLEKEVVAACLIGEAGGEGPQGMQAVMNVISNRAKGNPAQFVKVCLKPYQFSFFNEATVSRSKKLVDIVDKAKKHPKWNIAMELVQNASKKKLEDITQGATHYHTTAVNPSWAPKLKYIEQLGNHKFYN